METFPATGLPADFGPQLETLGIVTPTPIQAGSIPLIMEGHDLVGIAQTGTGKTLAFGLPIIATLGTGRALILAPTRELAAQIAAALRPFAGAFHLRTAVLVGGVGMQGQNSELRRNPAIVVATPGRLLDHVQKGHLRLREFKTVVLDEADRMLDMGFLPAIESILNALPKERQTLMFSATMADTISGLIKRHMRAPQRVEVTPPGSTVHLIEQSVAFVEQLDKNELLWRLINETDGQALVFARTRHGARKVAAAMSQLGLAAAEIHSDRTQNQRTAAIMGFRSGRVRVLVATDIAARGIDVKDISLVVQYDLPDDHDDYVHRIGRTGRAGATGRAVIFCTPEKSKTLQALEQTINLVLETAPESPLARPVRSSRRSGGQTNEPRRRSNVDERSRNWSSRPRPATASKGPAPEARRRPNPEERSREWTPKPRPSSSRPEEPRRREWTSKPPSRWRDDSQADYQVRKRETGPAGVWVKASPKKSSTGPSGKWTSMPRSRSVESHPTKGGKTKGPKIKPLRKSEGVRPADKPKKDAVASMPRSPKTGRPRPHGLPKSFKAGPKKGKKPAGFKRKR